MIIQVIGSLSAIGRTTFIPKKLNTSVGRVKKTVNIVRVFIVLFNSQIHEADHSRRRHRMLHSYSIISQSESISGLWRMLSKLVILRITLHGTPAAKEFSGMS